MTWGSKGCENRDAGTTQVWVKVSCKSAAVKTHDQWLYALWCAGSMHILCKANCSESSIGCQAEDSKKTAETETHRHSEAHAVLKQLSRFTNGLQVLQTFWSSTFFGRSLFPWGSRGWDNRDAGTTQVWVKVVNQQWLCLLWCAVHCVPFAKPSALNFPLAVRLKIPGRLLRPMSLPSPGRVEAVVTPHHGAWGCNSCKHFFRCLVSSTFFWAFPVPWRLQRLRKTETQEWSNVEWKL